MTVSDQRTGPRPPAPPRDVAGALRWRRRAVTVAVLVVAWAALGALGKLSTSGFPSFAETFDAFVHLLTQGFSGKTLAMQAVDSLSRWLVGVLGAVGLGVVVGLTVAWSRWADSVVRPIFEVLRFIPPIAWAPLAILWLGTGIQSQALVVFIAAFPPVVINTERAIRSVDPLLLLASRTLGGRGLQPLLHVALPVGIRTIVTGIRIACGNGWMALMGAELIGASSGLGYLIIQSQNNNNSADILVGMLTIGLIGLVIDTVTRLLESRVAAWHGNGPNNGA